MMEQMRKARNNYLKKLSDVFHFIGIKILSEIEIVILGNENISEVFSSEGKKYFCLSFTSKKYRLITKFYWIR
jgi:hypothetical protein